MRQVERLELVAVGEQEAEALRKQTRAASMTGSSAWSSIGPAVEQARRDRRRWQSKYERLAREIDTEPERVRRSYDVVADRLEIVVGLVHLWPMSN